MMDRRIRTYASFVAATALLVLLTWRTVVAPPAPDAILPAALFCLLVAFTTTFGVPLAGGRMSFLPMTTVAAYLALGLVPAGWVALLGALLPEFIRHVWAERLGMRREPDLLKNVGLGAANVIIQTLSIVVGGAVFEALGGRPPLTAVDLTLVPLLLLLGVTYLGVNFVTAGVYIAARSRKALGLYLRSLPSLLLYEGVPLIFAPLLALIHNDLGLAAFLLFAVILIIFSLIVHNLALTSQRLERRVKELGSLQAVGQALSSSLDLAAILEAIHRQVGELMPAHNFYVALYNPETEEVSFPLAIENDQSVRWQARRTGHGLSEYVMRTGEALLIRDDLPGTLKRLGITMIGRPAASWLGVPVRAGEETLGMLAVQSFSPAERYDQAHREVLITIAAQAAVAIQNAHLYTRTDEALARRVQELDSILRTAQEGILLLDTAWRIVAANRTLADFLGLAQGELVGLSLRSAAEAEHSILAQLGFTADSLAVDCQSLLQGEGPHKRQNMVLPGPPERPVERTLTPVVDREGVSTGWLLVLRDLTEERELERMREELTHLLIHDLRSPLTVMQGSISLVGRLLRQHNYEEIPKLLSMAQSGNEQMLHMINQLLDISQLESDRMPIHPEPVAVAPLLEQVAGRFAPLATAATIDLQVLVEPDVLPLNADAVLVGRVLDNLVDNAIKFTPDGGQVRLWARMASPASPPAVLIGVTDTGPGIPSDLVGNLFKKFQRVPKQTGRRRGSGLGLYFCRLVVETHGGQMSVASLPEQGSTFTLRLPAGQLES
jgi:PAS domain S-box-containing protein